MGQHLRSNKSVEWNKKMSITNEQNRAKDDDKLENS